MKTIYKYRFPITDVVKIEMPAGAIVLDAQIQDNLPVMWAVVDTDRSLKEKVFRVFGTGNPITADLQSKYKYISTLQSLNGGVWHLFEKIG